MASESALAAIPRRSTWQLELNSGTSICDLPSDSPRTAPLIQLSQARKAFTNTLTLVPT